MTDDTVPAPHHPSDSTALAALLAWHRDIGVIDAVADTPTDWLARGPVPPLSFAPDARPSAPPTPTGGQAAARPRGATGATATPPGTAPSAPPGHAAARQTPPPPAAPSRAFPTATPEAAETTARALATSAHSLTALEAALNDFEGCGLKATAKNLCFARGAATARVMIIGEAPGREEDIEGRPFVGRAGQLLDKMLAAIDLDEKTVHITNIVYWRPPGNRTPTPQEALVCRPFLERQVELVAPRIVLTLGGPATKAILDTDEGIMKVRGKWKERRIGTQPVRVMPTLHPAYLLRTPAAKRQAWRDLLDLRAALDALD